MTAASRSLKRRLAVQRRAKPAPGRDKVILSVYLDVDQKLALDDLNKATRVPTAIRIRDAVDGVIQRARAEGLLGKESTP